MKNILLPNKWVLKNLPDIFVFQEGPGVRKWQFRDKGIKLLNGSNINNGILDLSNTKIYLEESEVRGKYKHFLIDEGDLLIASSGVVVDNFHNKIAFVKKEHLPLCMNTSTIRFKVLNEKESTLQFLKFFLKTRIFKTQIGKLITGSAQLNFGPSHLKKIKIPIPCLNDQVRIAGILSRAEGLIEKRKESIQLLDEFLKSTFLEMFGDPVRNEKGWEKHYLSEKTKILENGWSPKCLPYTRANINEWAVLKLSSVTNLNFDPKENKLLPEETQPRELLEVKSGDLLITRKNTYDLVGACAYVFDTPGKLLLPDLIFRIKYQDINPVYLWYLFNDKHFSSVIRKLASGSAGSMPNISKTKLLKLIIPCPPSSLQDQFAFIVGKVETIKAKYQDSLEELENLYGSLSQRAFKGELDLSRVSVESVEVDAVLN